MRDTPIRPETAVVVGGRPSGPGAALNHPIGAASTFRAGGTRRYARSGTDASAAFEAIVGDLEGGRAVAFSSGMAAVSAVLELVPVGGRVAASRFLYVGTIDLLRRSAAAGRFDVRWMAPDEWSSPLEEVDLVFVEDPSNPALTRVDLTAVVEAARGRLVVADNTIATPLGCRPLEMGVDVVVHSATKFLGGHSDLLMGVVVTTDDHVVQSLEDHRLFHGAVPGALETFLATRGLRTLAVRMDRATTSAAELARRLARRPEVEMVVYPGMGALVALQVVGGADAADRLIDDLDLWTHATSLGGVESTLERRRRWADESEDVAEGLIRLSVGIEHVDDLWSDLAAALDRLP